MKREMRNLRGSGDGSPSVVFRGKALKFCRKWVCGLGDKVPQKLKHICLFWGSRNSKILLFVLCVAL